MPYARWFRHTDKLISFRFTSLVKKIIKQEGVRGLYKGMVPNYLKGKFCMRVVGWILNLLASLARHSNCLHLSSLLVAPAISISFVVYEQCKQVLIGKKTTAGM